MPLPVVTRLSALPGMIALAVVLSVSSGASKSASCPVTVPTSGLPGEQSFYYGSDSLRVAFWPRGKLVAGVLPDGSSYAETKPDGSIEAKLGWQRAVAGQLIIDGKKLDGRAPPLRTDIPEGYGDTGFQPAGLVFPTPGCWRIVGRVAGARLAFVALVTKR